MWPTVDEFNEVFESLLKGGTRYRTEKIAVVVAYAVVVVFTILWIASGVEIGGGLEGRLESRGAAELSGRTFVLTNTSSSTWNDVRVVINDRYLAKVDELSPERSVDIQPEEFTYYYHVSRPWGHAVWERIAGSDKKPRAMPADIELKSVRARTDAGDIRIQTP